MFKFFRFILILLSIATCILAALALVGSYQDQTWLTKAYLINFQPTQLKLGQLFQANDFKKRDNGLYMGNCYYGNSGAYGENLKSCSTPTTAQATAADTPVAANPDAATNAATGVAVAATTNAIPTGYTTTAGANTYTSATNTINLGSSSSSAIPSNLGNVGQIVQRFSSSLTYKDLGLADVYSISLWGYCRGTIGNQESIGQTYDNSNVTYTNCTKAKPAFFFDPLTVLKQELNNTIDDPKTDVNKKAALTAIRDNVSYENLNLPGDLEKNLKSMQSSTKALFAILVAVVVLSFISIIIQLLGCVLSPDHCCLSFLNFLFQCLIFVLAVVASGLSTGLYLYVRSQVNDNVKDYGVKSFLSISFYAYTWSSAAAAWLVIIFSLLGHCCGLFATNRHRFRTVHHHEESSSSDDEKLEHEHEDEHHH